MKIDVNLLSFLLSGSCLPSPRPGLLPSNPSTSNSWFPIWTRRQYPLHISKALVYPISSRWLPVAYQGTPKFLRLYQILQYQSPCQLLNSHVLHLQARPLGCRAVLDVAWTHTHTYIFLPSSCYLSFCHEYPRHDLCFYSIRTIFYTQWKILIFYPLLPIHWPT